MSVPGVLGGFGWSIKVRNPGAFWEDYKLETKGRPRANIPVTWTFRQCGASGKAGRAPQRAALGSLDQEAMQQETGLESGVLAALESE